MKFVKVTGPPLFSVEAGSSSIPLLARTTLRLREKLRARDSVRRVCNGKAQEGAQHGYRF